jgi:retron-type reverse transcriptase
MPNRQVEIPKGNGKVRTLQIPCIRDPVVQGAVKLILEAVFETDFCSNSYGFRPKRSPHGALAEVRRSVLRRMSTVIDLDLSRYFDSIPHAELMKAVARRVVDGAMLHLIKMWLEAPVEETDEHGRTHCSTRNRDEGLGELLNYHLTSLGVPDPLLATNTSRRPPRSPPLVQRKQFFFWPQMAQSFRSVPRLGYRDCAVGL